MITRSDQIVGVYQRFLNHIKHDYLGEIIVCLSQYYQVLKAKLSLPSNILNYNIMAQLLNL